jgi:16S rRNA (guanine527-N7)-methyltransferase
MPVEDLPPELVPQSPALSRYVDLLADEGIAWGLIGPNEDRERLWQRHVLNSLAITPLLDVASAQSRTLIDVGSGAGLPGIPLAIVRPELQITLLEPMLRRTRFLELAVERLELASRVAVIRGRAEEHATQYPLVTCRALAALPKLLTWCWPLVAPGGRLIAMKGQSAQTEVEAAAPTLRKLRLTAEVHELGIPGTDDHTWAVLVQHQ